MGERATVEIFLRETDEVVETREVELVSFEFYWDHQANDEKYGWRKVEEEVSS